MNKNADKANAKKEEITRAALELFFENGYEGTTIRQIQKKVGKEVGLFYYYFKNKDEAFEQALDLFFEDYKKDFEKIAESSKQDPHHALTGFFEYMEKEVEVFRERYADNLHWTVRKAVREHTLVVIEPYIRRIIEVLAEKGAKPRLEISVASMFLTHGIGSIILHIKKEDYLPKRCEMVKAVNLVMGIDTETYEEMIETI